LSIETPILLLGDYLKKKWKWGLLSVLSFIQHIFGTKSQDKKAYITCEPVEKPYLEIACFRKVDFLKFFIAFLSVL
jgi:hypothetical protein